MWDVECERRESRMTPRFAACPNGRVELIRVLIKKYLKKVLERQNSLDMLILFLVHITAD